MSGRWLGALLLAALLAGCQAFEPPATPHPGLVQLVTGMSSVRITLIDPARLAGSPISQARAVQIATQQMTEQGVVASWSVQVEIPGRPFRPAETGFGWVVVRGRADDPDLSGDEGISLVVIDATTGQPISLAPGPLPPPAIP